MIPEKSIVIALFMAKVEPEPNTGCWLWSGVRNGERGYGRFDSAPRSGLHERAHRASYELFVGPIPDDLLVLHTCDVRICVNPDHLFLGTQKQNMQDCIDKGRHPFSQSIPGVRRQPNCCPAGHPRTPENTMTETGRGGRPVRRCRVCYKATTKRKHDAARARKLAAEASKGLGVRPVDQRGL